MDGSTGPMPPLALSSCDPGFYKDAFPDFTFGSQSVG